MRGEDHDGAVRHVRDDLLQQQADLVEQLRVGLRVLAHVVREVDRQVRRPGLEDAREQLPARVDDVRVVEPVRERHLQFLRPALEGRQRRGCENQVEAPAREDAAEREARVEALQLRAELPALAQHEAQPVLRRLRRAQLVRDVLDSAQEVRERAEPALVEVLRELRQLRERLQRERQLLERAVRALAEQVLEHAHRPRGRARAQLEALPVVLLHAAAALERVAERREHLLGDEQRAFRERLQVGVLAGGEQLRELLQLRGALLQLLGAQLEGVALLGRLLDVVRLVEDHEPLLDVAQQRLRDRAVEEVAVGDEQQVAARLRLLRVEVGAEALRAPARGEVLEVLELGAFAHVLRRAPERAAGAEAPGDGALADAVQVRAQPLPARLQPQRVVHAVLLARAEHGDARRVARLAQLAHDLLQLRVRPRTVDDPEPGAQPALALRREPREARQQQAQRLPRPRRRQLRLRSLLREQLLLRAELLLLQRAELRLLQRLLVRLLLRLELLLLERVAVKLLRVQVKQRLEVLGVELRLGLVLLENL